MARAKKMFGTPVVRHHLAHELKDAIEAKGLTVSWIADQIESAIDQAKGEKKIPGLKFLLEVHEASAVARAQAAGVTPKDLPATVDTLPADRSARQFTRNEIETFMTIPAPTLEN